MLQPNRDNQLASSYLDEQQTSLYHESSESSLIEALHQAYLQNNYEQQVRSFIALGDYYLGKKFEYIDAIAIFNFALGICENEHKRKGFMTQLLFYQASIEERITKAEYSFLVAIKSQSQLATTSEANQNHKTILADIRQQAKDKLLQQEQFIKPLSSYLDKYPLYQKELIIEQIISTAQLSTQHIYQTIGEQMRDFVKLLIGECKKTLGEPPCAYAIVCFGSLARDEATPFSDLEFAIIIDDMVETFEQLGTIFYNIEDKLLSYREAGNYLNENNKNYFRNLANLLNIKILNLGETTPRAQHLVSLEHLGLLKKGS